MLFSTRVGGIEFTENEIRLAITKIGHKKPVVLALHACSVEPAEDAQTKHDNYVEAAKALFAKLKSPPASYVLSISSQYCVVRTLTVPFKGARRVAAAVRFELEPYLAFPIEELSVDHTIVAEINGQTEVLATGVRRAVLEEQLRIIKEAGIEPESIDIDATALTSLWHTQQPTLRGLHAVLHLVHDGAILAIVNGRKLAYFRRLSFDASTFYTNPTVAAREVQNSLRAFQTSWHGEGEVQSLTVTGDASLAGNSVLDDFAQHLEIPVSAQTLLNKLVFDKSVLHKPFPPEEGTIPEGSRWETVIGVALGACGKGFAFNFRSAEFTMADIMPRYTRHVFATTALALLLLSGVAAYFEIAHRSNMALNTRLLATTETLRKEVVSLQDQGIDVALEAFSSPTLLDILAELTSKMPEAQIAITQIHIAQITPDGPWITIQGSVKDDSAFPTIISALKQSPFFTIDEPEKKLAGGKSTFTIVARKKTSEEPKS